MSIRTLSSLAIAAVAAQLLLSVPAHAMLISDVQTIGATLGAGGTPSYSGSFSLAGYGVGGADPALTVTSANVSFTLLNYDGTQETVAAFLSGGDWFLGVSNSLMFSAFGGALSGSISSLNSSGTLGYTLNYLGPLYSSVYVAQGALIANATSVPEPGTLSLLGAGLLAGWLGKRRRKVAV